MSVSFEFEAQERSAVGRSAVRRLRSIEDKVPAIMYGADKAPMPISLAHNKIAKALENEAVYSHILTIHLGKESEKVVLKAIARHPTKPKILHVDFLRINTKEKLTMNIPLHFMGEEKAPGLKDGAGVLVKQESHLEILCLPQDLPEFIEVDISALSIGDTVHLSAIKLPTGVSLAHPVTDEEHDHAVVSI